MFFYINYDYQRIMNRGEQQIQLQINQQSHLQESPKVTCFILFCCIETLIQQSVTQICYRRNEQVVISQSPLIFAPFFSYHALAGANSYITNL